MFSDYVQRGQRHDSIPCLLQSIDYGISSCLDKVSWHYCLHPLVFLSWWNSLLLLLYSYETILFGWFKPVITAWLFIINAFITEYCVHCCGLQMFHVSASFMLLCLFVRIVWSQSILWDRRPMFVLVSLFLFCRSVFLLLLSADYHNVLMWSSLCDKTTFWVFFRVFSIVGSFTPIFCSIYINVCDMRSPTNPLNSSVAPPFKSIDFVAYCFWISPKFHIHMITPKTRNTSQFWFWFSCWC